MTARPSSRHRSIPVTVNVERRKTTRSTATSVPPTLNPVITQSPTTTQSAWGERRRRRMMWFIVVGGGLVILVSWGMVFSAQLNGNTPTFFVDVSRLIRNVRWPWEPQPLSPQEQEIRNLEQQVFPQFQ